MNENKTLNQQVNTLIHNELQKTINKLAGVEEDIKWTEEQLAANKKLSQDLILQKHELEEILRTHDATYTHQNRFSYPTEFKVRE